MSAAANSGRRWLRWGISLLPALLLLGALIWSHAFAALGETLQRVGPGIWMLALVGQALSYAGRAIRLRVIDRKRLGPHLGTCLRLILVNNALNLVLPLRAGEASFPLLLRQWFGIELLQATGTLIWMRLLDLQVLAIAAALCLLWLGPSAPFRTAPLSLAMLALLTVSPLLLWQFRDKVLDSLARRRGRIASLASQVLQGMPSKAGLLLEAWLWTLLSWSIKLTVLGLLLATLAQSSSGLGMLGAIGGDLSTVLPVHAPGGFGSFEAGVLAMTAALEPPTPRLLSAALGYHLFVLAFALSAGLLAWVIPVTRTRAA